MLELQSIFVAKSEHGRYKNQVCVCSLSCVCAGRQLHLPAVKEKQHTELLGWKKGEPLSQGPFSVHLSPAIVLRAAAVAASAEGGSNIEQP